MQVILASGAAGCAVHTLQLVSKYSFDRAYSSCMLQAVPKCMADGLPSWMFQSGIAGHGRLYSHVAM